MGTLARGTVLLLLIVSLAGCSATIAPAMRQDAQTAVRVRTALVNDPALGVYPIAVRVDGGIVELTGEVATETEIAQATALVRQVPGVADVRARLQIRPALADPAARAAVAAARRPPQYEEPIERSTDRRRLAVGGSVRFSSPQPAGLDSSMGVGPNVRLGMGTGPGLSIGFGWFNTDLHGAGGGEPIARLRIRPVMAGLGYTIRRQRAALSLSLVGGVALNSIKLPALIDTAEAAVAIDHSFAWRPGASFWYDANDRVAFNVFTGYLVTRPRVTFLEHGDTRRREVRADTLVVTAGAVYKVF